MNFNMQIELDRKELDEVIRGLSKNRGRIRSRMNHGKRQLIELHQIEGGAIDAERELYLNTLVTLRNARIERISKLIQRMEEYAKDTDFS
jgi:hypothetical protein